MFGSRYTARLATSSHDLKAALSLRARAFRNSRSDDQDAYDPLCQHLLIEHEDSRALVCTFRLLPIPKAASITTSYAAQHYDLGPLDSYNGAKIEVGRFCVDPAFKDPNIFRTAWGALTAYVDRQKIDLLFGCSSFQGIRGEDYADSFALLADRYLAPARWRPGIKARSVLEFSKETPSSAASFKSGMRNMPPLLRSYLTLGGWVSDHAVIDRDLSTIHVFTGLEVQKVPAARSRQLRLLAG